MSLWSRWTGWLKKLLRRSTENPMQAPAADPATAHPVAPRSPEAVVDPLPLAPVPSGVEPRQGYGEVVELVRAVREHLNQQADRSERLLEMLHALPRAIETLPETNRNQSRMLEVLQLHLDQQGRQASKLHEVLATLAHASETSTQMMGLMQQHVDSNRENNERFIQSFQSMGEILQRIGDSTHSSLQSVREFSVQSDRRLQEIIDRNNRHVLMLSITGWVTAAIAAALAVYVAVKMH